VTAPRAIGLTAVCALSLAGAHAAFARPETTTPGVVYTIGVVLSDASITVGRDRFTRDGEPTYPRGAVIHYEISNGGTRPYGFRIWDRVLAPIRPGGHRSLLINWNYRGSFGFWTLFRNRPAGPKGEVIVF
jgi:hypothetical protein